MSNSSSGKLYDYQQASALLGIKVSTLYSMVSRREVPHLRIGRRLVRFPHDELMNWLRAKLVVPTPAVRRSR